MLGHVHDSDRPCHAHAGHAHHTRNRTRLTWTLALVLVYLVAEAIGGWLANSLALLADAGHMLSDAAALALSLFALSVAQWPATPAKSFGYARAEILAALVNGATLLAIAGYILFEAAHRFFEPPPVQGALAAAIAAGGLVINLIGLGLLHSARDENLNIRGAWLHLLTDTLGSLAALTSGGLIWALGWNWVDAIASAVIALLVVYSSGALLSEAVAILMESAPARLHVPEIRAALLKLPGVSGVHDLHVWSIGSDHDAVTVHLVTDQLHDCDPLLRSAHALLSEQFGLDHVTVQIEPPDFPELLRHE